MLKKILSSPLLQKISPKGDPAGLLTLGYIAGLALIAILSIGVHLISARISTLQENNTRIAYHISQDRSNIETVALYTAQHYANNEAFDFDILKQSIQSMLASHNKLLDLITTSDQSLAPNRTLYQMYVGDKFKLAESTQNFIVNADTYTKYTSSQAHPKRTEAKDFVTQRARVLIVPLLNQALENYQTQTLELTAEFKRIQLMGTLLILVVLALEALFIFKPLVAKIRNSQKMLMRQAMEDPLTGLNNRRAFVKQADFEIRRSNRSNTLMVVALADLDNFKAVNDTYGHDVGDKVIQHFSDTLQSSMRAGDVIGRIGGEEFGLVLPSTDQDSAQLILDRLCKNIEQSPCEYGSEGGKPKSLNYTVSIGFVTKTNSDQATIDDLLKKADKALYEAKEKGRNRVKPFSED